MGTRTRFFDRNLKIELIAPIFNIILGSFFILILLTNQTYYVLFNTTLGTVLGIEMNWVLAIYIYMGVVIAGHLVLLILGCINMEILHLGRFPSMLILPVGFLVFSVFFLFFIVNLEKRITLDYVFFMFGNAALPVYILLSIGSIGMCILVVLRAIRTWNQDSRLKLRYAGITASISSFTTSILFWVVCLKYAPTSVFWRSLKIIYGVFMPWNEFGAIIWIVGILGVVTIQIVTRVSKTKVKQVTHYSLLGIFGTIQLVGIVIVCIQFPLRYDSFWWTVLPLLLGSTIITYIPSIADRIKVLLVKKISNVEKRARISVLIILLSIFLPYTFIFYAPLGITVPSVVLPYNERLINIKGVDVPFQGDVVYPSFEKQPLNDSGGNRYDLDLNGTWKWYPTNKSHDISFYTRSDEVIAELSQGQHTLNFDDSEWEDIYLPKPHSFPYRNAVVDEHRYGVIWYRKIVEIPSYFNDHQLLMKFYGGGYVLDLWINGIYIGFHEITQFQFVFDVTDEISPGQENTIAIRVDDPSWEETMDSKTIWDGRHLPAHIDFFKYGGITREIHLEAIPQASIVRTDVKVLEHETQNHLNGNISVQTDVVVRCPAEGSITGEIANITLNFYPLEFPNSSAIGDRNTWKYANFSEPIMNTKSHNFPLIGEEGTDYTTHRFTFELRNVDFWSTRNPKLYLAEVNLTVSSHSSDPIDKLCTQTGFRTIETNGTQILLNGADLKLAGASLHEEMYDPYGTSVEDWQIVWKLELLKNISVNFIRLSAYPMHPNWYLFAERMGIASWAESPTCWMNEIDFTNMFARNSIVPIWIQTVYPNINRPGILFWGGPNEPWAAGDCIRFLKVSKCLLDQIDGTRFFSYAAVSSHTWHIGFEDAELPVISPNNYGGTFDGVRYAFYEESVKSLAEWTANNPGKPIVNTEFGYWRENTWNGTEWVPNWENQINCLNETVRAFQEFNAAGFTWWIGFDYFGHSSNTQGWYSNGMGVYNLDGTVKYPTANVMNNIYGNFTISNL
ncbi:MAG: hypothetical protein EU530_03475 [Promethearchaeota archaeon]|nr:MAG: hypothetical protein EU530_03475 [Candidatus Lokiarchaeota archaeon]